MIAALRLYGQRLDTARAAHAGAIRANRRAWGRDNAPGAAVRRQAMDHEADQRLRASTEDALRLLACVEREA